VKTQVGIIGAGPAGLLLAQILMNNGISSVVVEHRSRDYVLSRIRAGVLEPGAVATFCEQGVGQRLMAEGMPHDAMQLRWGKTVHSIPQIDDNGRHLTTYGQSEIVRDMIEIHEADGLPILWETEVTELTGLYDAPEIRFTHEGQPGTLHCDFIAGCDGFHGVSRRHVPGAERHSYLKRYPFAWLGILAAAAPHPDKRGYAHTPEGAAIASARSPSVGRLYLQVPPGTDPADWTDAQIWDELDRRFEDGTGTRLNRGEILSKDVTELRAFICETMQHNRLFLAGDAAHIVPPSGAKGLNLAVGDVIILAEAIRRNIVSGETELMDAYTTTCLRRIHATVHWSNLLAETLHAVPGQSAFDTVMQEETLRKWTYTDIGRATFVSSALGLPYEL